MRLFKITTKAITKDAKPDLDYLTKSEDLMIDRLSLPLLKKALEKENIHRQLNSNDIFSIQNNGRTLVYRFSDTNLLWIIDVEHKDYIRFQRDNLLNLILD